MPYSIQTSIRRGFSLVELIITITILIILVSIVILAINPAEIKARARDGQRLGDIHALVVGIESYRIDTGILPDLANVTHKSNIFSSGSYPQKSDGTGWIQVNLEKYLSSLPADPLNQIISGTEYVYRYRQNGLKYKVDTILEYYNQMMIDDGGIDNSRYEKGTGLDIVM